MHTHLTVYEWATSILKACIAQLFLAMPAACPSSPDGSKRTVPKEDYVKHVTLFQSNDEGKDFEQACPLDANG